MQIFVEGMTLPQQINAYSFFENCSPIACFTKKRGHGKTVAPFLIIGRGERTRTSDPLYPIQVRYQTALRPDNTTLKTGVTRQPLLHILLKDNSPKKCFLVEGL